MKRENFYRRNPSDALAGMVGMTLEERGVYNTVIDLLYSTWRPVEDSRPFIANWCGCAVQKLNPILERLIARRKLIRFEEDGVWYISNGRFEEERAEVKGGGRTRSGRAQVREKSDGVEEKSAGVEENPPVLDTDIKENQGVTPLEKSRVEQKEAIASSVGPEAPTSGTLFEDVEEPPDGPKAKPWESSPAFAAFWARCGPQMRTRSSKAKAWQPWRSVVAKIGAEALLAAVGRYVAGDTDFQRSGGPGVHIWLKDGRWEHWLAPAPGASDGGVDQVLFPEREVRQACVIEFGEDWVRRNLDHCAWQQVPEKAIRAPNKFIAGNLHREATFFRALGIHSVKIKSEAAA